MSFSRSCARPGCRAWAMHDGEFCRAHQTVIDRAVSRNGISHGYDHSHNSQPDDQQSDERSAARQQLDAVLEREIARQLLKVDEHSPADSSSLAGEIRALRLVLLRVLADEPDPRRLATAIPRLTDSLVRAIRAERTMRGDQADDLSAALTQVLMELGLDGSDE